MAVEDIHGATVSSITSSEPDAADSAQTANLKGNKVSISTGSVALALLMEETIELASSPINSRAAKNAEKKKKITTKKDSAEGQEEDEDLDKKPVEKTKKTAQIDKTKEQGKQYKDPFFEYRDLKDERDKLIQETAPENRGKIQDRLNDLNSQMAVLYKENASLIDSGLAIDPAVQTAVAEFQDKSVDISEQSIHQNYRNVNEGYKDAVLDYGTIRETYNKIVETYTEEYFEDGLRTLTNALSKDLMRFNTQTEGSLSDKTQLSLISQDLYKLKNLHSFYLNCTELLDGFTTENVSMGSFVHKFLDLLEKNWVETTDIEEVAKLVGDSPKSEKVLGFLNRMLLAVKSLPTDNEYSTGTDGANTELFDAINSLREEKAVEENKRPISGSKI